MPTYEYECRSCGESLELFQKITESPRKKCPACGRMTLRRLIGAGGGFIFKGSGFYITDYRSEDYKAKAKAEKESASSGGGDGDGGTSGGDGAKSGEAAQKTGGDGAPAGGESSKKGGSSEAGGSVTSPAAAE